MSITVDTAILQQVERDARRARGVITEEELAAIRSEWPG
jgi:hypothetical protein